MTNNLKDFEQVFIAISELTRGYHAKLKHIGSDIRELRKKNQPIDDLREQRTVITKLHSRCMLIKSRIKLENYPSYSSETMELLAKYRQL